MPPIRLLVAERDITRFQVDAIVNSVDPLLKCCGGLNRQIYQMAGTHLMRSSRRLKEQGIGEVRLTLGYELPARYILHAFVPTAHGPSEEEQRFLAQCYHKALTLASQRQFRTVVFPVLGSGQRGALVSICTSGHNCLEGNPKLPGA